MAEEALFNVLGLKGKGEKRVPFEVDLRGGEIVGGPAIAREPV
jgi:hypothetical protein